MQQIIDFIAQEAATVLLDIALLVLTVLGGILANLARQHLGEKNMDVLRDRLDGAIDRAIAAAHAKGINEESIKEDVEDYLSKTMSQTMSKIGASPSELRSRVVGQIAIKKAKGFL